MWRDIAWRELGASRRVVLSWWIPLAGMLVLICALQPSLASGMLAAKVESMPDAMRRAFGIELVDFHRPAAYLATNFLYVTLSVSLLASRLGAGSIAREEVLHTAELLYTQPITRTRVLAGKAVAVALCVIAVPVGLAGVALATLAGVAEQALEPALIVSLFVAAAALGVCFAGLGMLVATLVRDARSASGVALGVMLGTWFLGLVSVLSPRVAFLGWLSPYKLLEPPAIVAAGGVAPARAFALVAIGVVCGAIAVARYRRRDLHA
jgi:beta-exotoxin I transport system permease protein